VDKEAEPNKEVDMWKVIAVAVVLVIGLGCVLLWICASQEGHVIRLVVCPGATNNEPKIEGWEDGVVYEFEDRWYCLKGPRLKIQNDSNHPGVKIIIPKDFFEEAPNGEAFSLAKGDTRSFTMKKGLASGFKSSIEIRDLCGHPGPTLIKRP
jgi:hypothetical protein